MVPGTIPVRLGAINMNAFLTETFGLRGKVALITGAGKGLGQAIAVAYAQCGATVLVLDADGEAAKATAGQIRQAGGQSAAFACDVADSREVHETIARILDQIGSIDILVNNAGIGRRARAESMTDEEWDQVLDINLKGAFHLCREVGKTMIERGRGGRIINMASITGLVGIETGNANYAASKGGLIAMTRCLAIEWAKHHILVNAIAPTHIRTPLIERLMSEKPETRTYFLNNIPLGRLGEVDDVVGPAIFLASDASRFMTGHVLTVDGGHTAK